MSDGSILENLNNKQSEAVQATEGYVRVIAGAGSGKTKLLVSRYAYLVKDYGIDSANILCVTFTNKAAAEMKRRIRNLIGDEYDTSLICTYHGFCNRLLREDTDKLFLNKQFQIIDIYQQKTMLSEIYQKYELKLDYGSFEKTLRSISTYKHEKPYVDKICDPEACQILAKIENQDDQILEDYLQRQKATYSLDFDDLIFFALRMLEKFEDVCEKWQSRLNYIMVDEFQDSSSVEMRLIEVLSNRYKNLMIVGDPDQNIYEWRGSDVKLLVDFDKDHEPTDTIILNQNYRSTPEILKCANTLIEKNKLRLKKDLFTNSPNGAEVIHYHSKNDAEEMDRIVNSIKVLMEKEGLKYSDFAILYRSGFLSRVAEKKLVEKNIPYEIYGGVKFYQRMEILDILAYLKLLAFDDDISFKRIVNVPRRKFGRSKLQALESMMNNHSGPDYQISLDDYGSLVTTEDDNSMYKTLKRNLGDRRFADSNVGQLIRVIDDIRIRLPNMRISEIVNEITSSSGYEEYIRSLGDEERLDNLSEFKRIANEFERDYGEDLTLPEFLQQLAIMSNEYKDRTEDTVKLMTIHASKGLEFPVVYILGLSEGIFPSSKTIEERKLLGMEEERRLCYVAITRAEKHLFLMDSEGQSPSGSKKLYSRFLDEIGTKNYLRIGEISDDIERETLEYRAQLNRELYITDGGKSSGDVVEHHVFGRGKVLEIDSNRGSYIVKFDKLDQPRAISQSYFKQEHKPLKLPEEKADTEWIPMPEEEIEEVIEEEENIDEDDYEDEEEAISEVNSDDSKNLWKRDDVPHSGWVCVGVVDLGKPIATCEMCGRQIIRYAHYMAHPDYHQLTCGCVCAGRMEGNIDRARQREAELKNRSRRKKTKTVSRKTWRTSQKGNQFLKIDEHVLVVFFDNKHKCWKFAYDSDFPNRRYETIENAKAGAIRYHEERLKNLSEEQK